MPDADFAVSDSLVRRAARGDFSPSRAKDEIRGLFDGATNPPPKQALKVLVAYAKDRRRTGQIGRLCGAVVLGVAAFGDSFIEHLNRERLLVCDEPIDRFEAALGSLSTRLHRVEDPMFTGLRERVDTYLNLYRLRAASRVQSANAIAALRTRPFQFGKTLLAIANLAFLRDQFGFTGGSELARAYETFRSPEEVAAAVSAIIALANDVSELNSQDFALPLPGVDLSPLSVELLHYGRVVSRLAEVEKLISVFGYQLARARTGRPTVYRLTAPSTELEYTMRLGFIRGELGTTASGLHVADRGNPQLYSIHAAVDRLLTTFGGKLSEIRDADTPYRRLRVLIPVLPELFEHISTWRFHEDLLTDERLAQEFELPLRVRGSASWELSDGIDLPTFRRTWRILDFLNVLDCAILKRHQDDSGLLYNSLIRVIGTDQFIQLLSTFGLTRPQVSAFLGLVAVNVGRMGHFDIQYRPFLVLNPATFETKNGEVNIPSEIILAPAVVAVANILPNLQRAHGIRVATNAEAFVAVAAEELRSVLPRVKTNAAVKYGSQRTDIDIVAMSDDSLYLFECKHSITPTGAHEMRDLWRDIEKGVTQLEVALGILNVRLTDYLAGWFPGTARDVATRLKIRPCVLCSHRVFSGLTIRGIPVRDHASLGLILGDAILQIGTHKEAQTVNVIRYRLRATADPSPVDLDNYMSGQSTFFRMFEPFMRPYTAIDYVQDKVILVQESFVYQLNDEAWRANLESLGAHRLPDEEVTIGPAQPPDVT